jgi:hypothetical protein
MKCPDLSPRDIEAIADKAKTKDSSLNIEINGEKVIKKAYQTKQLRSLSIGNARRKKSYKKAIEQLQNELPILNRLFSKIIHTPIIEEVTDFICYTILRPNAILCGSILALLVTILNYILINQYGYVLSGYEPIIAFGLGWLIGMILDYLKIIVTGKK